MKSVKVRAAAGLAALCLLAAGCGSGSDSATTTPAAGGGGTTAAGSSAVESSAAASGADSSAADTGATDAPPAGSTEGTMTIWADALATPALKQAAEDFGATNGIAVQVQTIAKDLQAQFVTASQAGNAPDLVLGAHDWIGNLVQNGAIDPITIPDAVASKFNPLAIQGVTFNGQTWGIPFAVENIALYRNTDLAPDAPATFDDLITNGQALVSAGTATEILSLPQGQNGDPYHLYPLFTSAGGTLFGKTANGDYDPKDLQLASPESLTAAAKIASIGETGSGALKRSITNDNALSLFTDGKAAYYVSGPWNLAKIKESGIKYDISPIPGFADGGPAKPFIGVQALYVASKGANKALAQEFATNYFASPAVAEALYAAYGRPPALTEAYDTVAAADPDIAKFAEAAKDGDILPSIPEMQAVWTPWGIAESAIIGGADPNSSFEKANETIKTAIGG